jgi:hypothetical protein
MGLAVFGRRGGDCEDIEALVHPSALNGAAEILSTVPGITAHGKTPLAAALRLARRELGRMSAGRPSGRIYVVTDGVETCDGDPVGEARAFESALPGMKMSIIGIGVSNAEARLLAKVARAAKGEFEVVNSAEQLQKAVREGAHHRVDFLAPEFEILYESWCGYPGCERNPPRSKRGPPPSAPLPLPSAEPTSAPVPSPPTAPSSYPDPQPSFTPPLL